MSFAPPATTSSTRKMSTSRPQPTKPSSGDRPSVVLLRLRTPRPAARLAAVLIANLEGVAADLAAGAIVVLEDERVRVRLLPLA